MRRIIESLKLYKGREDLKEGKSQEKTWKMQIRPDFHY